MTKWPAFKEAEEYLKMGRSTLYKPVRQNRVPAHKAGREWRFDAAEPDKWLKSGKPALPEGHER